MTENTIQTFSNAIKSLEKRITETVSAEIKPNQFITAACMALSKDEKLLKCDIKSIQMAVMQAASDGLMLDGNEAALVAFGSTCNYMPMVQGIIKLAKMFGDVKDITTEMVYENDHFRWIAGDFPTIEHEPQMSDRGNMIGGYVIVTMNDGTKKRLVMPKEDLERIRATSRSPNGIWTKHYNAMCAKTLIRQISKELNLSPIAERVIKDVDRYHETVGDVTAITVDGTATGVIDTVTGEVNPAIAALQQSQQVPIAALNQTHGATNG